MKQAEFWIILAWLAAVAAESLHSSMNNRSRQLEDPDMLNELLEGPGMADLPRVNRIISHAECLKMRYDKFCRVVGRNEMSPLLQLELSRHEDEEAILRYPGQLPADDPVIRLYEFLDKFLLKDNAYLKSAILTKIFHCLNKAGILYGCREGDEGFIFYKNAALCVLTQLYIACVLNRLCIGDLIIMIAMFCRNKENILYAIHTQERLEDRDQFHKPSAGLLCFDNTEDLARVLERTPVKNIYRSEDAYTALNHITPVTILAEVKYYQSRVAPLEKSQRFLPAAILQACFPGVYSEAFLFTGENYTKYIPPTTMSIETEVGLLRVFVACSKMQLLLRELWAELDALGISYRSA